MAMYFPQDTSIDMGPTCIVPRSQYNTPDKEGKKKANEKKIWTAYVWVLFFCLPSVFFEMFSNTWQRLKSDTCSH